jgi:hypothetical protein
MGEFRIAFYRKSDAIPHETTVVRTHSKFAAPTDEEELRDTAEVTNTLSTRLSEFQRVKPLYGIAMATTVFKHNVKMLNEMYE